MSTVKLYQQDVYLKESRALVTDVVLIAGSPALVLDRTLFFPEGGGQPADLGTIATPDGSCIYDVLDVREKDGEIYHTLDVSPETLSIHREDEVQCVLNWPRRFDHMQRHCGEHILSGIFFREYGGVNCGFHMGEDFMTIDINPEENPEIKEISWEMALHAELCANEAVWNNLPVITRRFDKAEEAAKLPLRKALALDEDISVVCVGDVNNPADCVACCGTHPATSGQVGIIKIYKVESYKGMTRVFFEAGARAMADYDRKHDLLLRLYGKYSASIGDLLDKIASQDAKAKAVKAELIALKQVVIAEKTDEIRTALEEATPEKILVKEFQGLTTEDLLRVGRAFEGSVSKLLMLIVPAENTLLLFSDGKRFDCGKLVKENAPILNGKGGGGKTCARALFPNREYLDTYIDLIEKHLR